MSFALPHRPHRPAFTKAIWQSLLIVLAPFLGCESEPPPRQPPPPEPATAAGCSGPKKFRDPTNVQHLPAKVGSYCLDRSGSDRGYGSGAKEAITGIREQFDGEAEIYLGFGVKRVVEARYIDSAGSGMTVELNLSMYPKATQSLAMFSKRTVGTSDPAHPDSPRPIQTGGAAALGMGNAYLWVGPYLAELTLSSSKASPDALRKTADAVLPGFLKALATQLPTKKAGVPELEGLPTQDRLPLGFRYITNRVLGTAGSGPGAMGYYRKGQQRWRLVRMQRTSPTSAATTFKALCKPGKKTGSAKGCQRTVRTIEKLGSEACALTLRCGSGAETQWLIAMRDNEVLAIGDEERVLRQGQEPTERAMRCLSAAQKRDLLSKNLAKPQAQTEAK